MNITTTETCVLNLTIVVSPSFSNVMVSLPILLPSRVISKTRSSVVGAAGSALAAGGTAVFAAPEFCGLRRDAEREEREHAEKKSVLSEHRSLFRNGCRRSGLQTSKSVRRSRI